MEKATFLPIQSNNFHQQKVWNNNIIITPMTIAMASLGLYYLSFSSSVEKQVYVSINTPDWWQVVRCVHLPLMQRHLPLNSLTLGTKGVYKRDVCKKVELCKWLAKQGFKTGLCLTERRSGIFLTHLIDDRSWDVFICLSCRGIFHSIVWHWGQKAPTKVGVCKKVELCKWLAKQGFKTGLCLT